MASQRAAKRPDNVVTTEVARAPRAKRKAMAKLPAWQRKDDDSDDERRSAQAAAERLATQGWSPFKQDVDAPDRTEIVDAGSPGGDLKSYEDRVLGLNKDTDGHSKSETRGDEGGKARSVEDSDTSSDKSEESEDELNMTLEKQDRALITEVAVLTEEQRELKKDKINWKWAARTIQDIIKIRHDRKNQRMKLYQQAEEQGREQHVRDSKLLAWCAVLSVLTAYDRKMRDPEVTRKHTEKFLESLALPPPPPPSSPPPTSEDEKLHNDYEETRLKYKELWESAGKTHLGHQKYEELRNRVSVENVAESQKVRVAEYCKQYAKDVRSEKEHKAWLRKAWRLEDNYSFEEDSEHLSSMEIASRS